MYPFMFYGGGEPKWCTMTPKLSTGIQRHFYELKQKSGPTFVGSAL